MFIQKDYRMYVIITIYCNMFYNTADFAGKYRIYIQMYGKTLSSHGDGDCYEGSHYTEKVMGFRCCSRTRNSRIHIKK